MNLYFVFSCYYDKDLCLLFGHKHKLFHTKIDAEAYINSICSGEFDNFDVFGFERRKEINDKYIMYAWVEVYPRVKRS